MARSKLPAAPKTLPPSESWLRWMGYVEEILYKRTVTINPTSVAANTTDEQEFSVPGVKSNSFVWVNKPTETAGLGIVNCRAATDKIYITFMNCTGSSIDPASEAYLIVELRV